MTGTRMFCVLFLLMAGLAAAGARASDICAEPVRTTEGAVTGASNETGSACVYKGIPYAAPPVGELRWRPPRDPPARGGVLPALAFSNQCMQPEGPLAAFNEKETGSSEDCLYLNIWRPMKSGSFPVLFWIHGGGFMQGTGAAPIYWGDRLLAGHDVVLVTINYRLGPLGFLSQRDLAARSPDEGSGNYGILDQTKALEWVKRNIAGFGGDPGRVTIFGESAGGFSVCTLLASPLAKGLFQRAIMESGACIGVKSEESGFDDGDQYAKRLGCAGAAAAECLQGQSARALIEAVPKTGGETDIKDIEHRLKYVFIPHVDGYALKETPIEAIRSGRFNDVPLIIGTNRDEVKMFTALSPGFRMMGKSKVEDFISAIIGDDDLAAFRRLYPYASYRRRADAAIAALGDMFLGCPSLDAVEAASARSIPVYYYRFDHDDHRAPHMIGAAHGLEVPYVFGGLDVMPIRLLYSRGEMESAARLSDAIMDYWTNFAYSGNPNGPRLPEWPAYDGRTKMRLHLDQPIHVEPADNAAKCGFWQKQGFDFE